MNDSNQHSLWDSGIIKSIVKESEAMTARLLKCRSAFQAQKWSAVRAAEQSCQIFGVPCFYPQRQVGPDHISRFTPVLEQL